MNLQLLFGLILTLLPLTELRIGLPLIIHTCLNNNYPILPWFVIVLILNIAIIFAIFFFLDFLHHHFLKIKIYRRVVGIFIRRIQKKGDKVQKKMEGLGFLALFIFVGIPLPGTGAWTGTFVAWILGLNRKNSIISISLGIIAAGLIILLLSLGLFGFI